MAKASCLQTNIVYVFSTELDFTVHCIDFKKIRRNNSAKAVVLRASVKLFSKLLQKFTGKQMCSRLFFVTDAGGRPVSHFFYLPGATIVLNL